MSQPIRDATVVLIDHLSFIPWLRQLKSRCGALRIWHLVDPSGTTEPRTEPTPPDEPDVTNYTPSSNLNDEVPERPSDLSATGLKAYKEDVEYYKQQPKPKRTMLARYYLLKT